jgi:raffinose/stachyose/melibiose transport system permease protein
LIRTRREAALGYVALFGAMVLTVLPLLSMVSAALQPRGPLPVGLQWPNPPHWENFVEAFEVAHIGQLMFSSIVIVIGVVPLAIVLSALGGYALARLVRRGSTVVLALLVLGLTVPFESIVVPLYYEMQALHLLNTPLAVILPLIGLYMPFGIIWMRAQFLGLPRELSEAARLDGANTWKEFWLVSLPLLRPGVVALGLILFLWTWNQFLLAIVMIDDPLKRTVAGALGAFQGKYSTDIVLLCAGSLLIIAPTIIVFLIFQRQFVQAMLHGAVKG